VIPAVGDSGLIVEPFEGRVNLLPLDGRLDVDRIHGGFCFGFCLSALEPVFRVHDDHEREGGARREGTLEGSLRQILGGSWGLREGRTKRFRSDPEVIP
jgi:hypothetical protein